MVRWLCTTARDPSRCEFRAKKIACGLFLPWQFSSSAIIHHPRMEGSVSCSLK